MQAVELTKRYESRHLSCQMGIHTEPNLMLKINCDLQKCVISQNMIQVESVQFKSAWKSHNVNVGRLQVTNEVRFLQPHNGQVFSHKLPTPPVAIQQRTHSVINKTYINNSTIKLKCREQNSLLQLSSTTDSKVSYYMDILMRQLRNIITSGHDMTWNNPNMRGNKK